MKIKIITQNCFDSPLSSNRFNRINFLISKIINLNPDVIFLQEINFSKTAFRVMKALKDAGYHVFCQPGLVLNRGGLLTASRISIDNLEFHRFGSQGKILSLQIADRILGKGFQKMTTTVNGNKVSLFNVHFVSIHNRRSFAERKTLESQFEMLSLKSNEDKIICGDFNFTQKDPLYHELLKKYDFVDPLESTNLKTIVSNNTNKKGIYKDGLNVKFDYTFISKKIAKNIKSDVIFDELFAINKQKTNLSDHFGLFTVFEV